MQGIDWLASHFRIDQNSGAGPLWAFYYLVGLERVGRLSGSRSIGEQDWYRLGAESLVQNQDKTDGSWQNAMIERNKTLATSFALIFLAKGRAPVLIKKLRHSSSNDWNNDPDDISNLVEIVSRDRKTLLTWQVADPNIATIQELLEAPILFFNGHKAPELGAKAKQNLRDFVKNGEFIFAEACCASGEFDRGFRELMKEILPADVPELQPLAENHPIWRAKNQLTPEAQSLWGVDQKNRTVVIYSRRDLSCYWNQAEQSAANPAVIKAIKVAQNVIEYATGGKILADKLVQPRIAGIKLTGRTCRSWTDSKWPMENRAEEDGLAMNTELAPTHRDSALAVILLFPFRAVERTQGWRRIALLVLYGLIAVGIWGFLWRQSQLARLPDVGDSFGVAAFREPGRVSDDRNAFIPYRQAAQRFREMNEAEGNAFNNADLKWSRADAALRGWVAKNDQAIALMCAGRRLRPDVFLEGARTLATGPLAAAGESRGDPAIVLDWRRGALQGGAAALGGGPGPEPGPC